MDGEVLTLLSVRGISREINRKRVTSVEVKFNRFETVLEAAPLKSPARDGRWLRRGTCVKQSHLGLYGQAARLISTGKLNALLRFHILPINHLVLMVPSGESSSREISSWGVLPA